MVHEREVAEEQAHLDRAHAALDAMRDDARSMLGGVLDIGRGGTLQSRTERDIVVNTALMRLQQLDIGDQALCFGRIDTAPSPGREGESFHIGRVAVSGEGLEPLVVDWRAPVAEPFYRATGVEPLGLARRRHLQVRHREVLGVEDEYFNRPDGLATDADPVVREARDSLVEGLALGGPGALLAAMGEARTGQMGDIVATIQREQDEIIRAPLPGLLLVQGGPGTGKTAVALHRAAYLLYTHRFPLERQGVLVVGPNPLFLRYIEQVLPSLGETGVTLSTIAGLVPAIEVTAVSEPDDVAALKGEARMARLVSRAVRTRQRPLRDDAQIPFGVATLLLTVQATADVVARARRRPGTHNQRHRFVERELAGGLASQYRRRVYGNVTDGEDDDVEEQIRRTPEFRAALRRIWPRLAPHELVHDLLGARALLRAAGEGLFTEHEFELLARPRSDSLDDVAWTPADAALVDEARAVLGPARTVRRTVPVNGVRELFDSPATTEVVDEETIRSYGHIVVDEVQDLSAMQLRMLARRSISGSMTVVGDMGQATAPGAASSWDLVVTHLTPRRPPITVELTVSYRTPKEVLEVAAAVLAVAEPGIRPPIPVRTTGLVPDIRVVHRDELATELVAAARRELSAITEGRVAVLVASEDFEEIEAVLRDAGIAAVDPRDKSTEGLAARLVVLPVDVANGLEFDSVIVVEPARIVARADRTDAPTPRGLRMLYVSMTRPTRRLTVLGSVPLPFLDYPDQTTQRWHVEAVIN